MAEVESESKKVRKLKKEVSLENNIVTIKVIDGQAGAVAYSPNDLSDDMKKRLLLAGLSHKLGDAASSVRGVEAEKAIARVWDGLKKGEWSTRGPAQPKIALSEIAGNLASLTPAQQKKAMETLEALGIALPEAA